MSSPQEGANPRLDPPPNSRLRRVAHNTAAQSATTIGVLVVGLIVTSAALSHIGLVEFGIWSYVATTVSYLAIVDPGIGLFITRYAARARTADERVNVSRVISFGMLAWLVLLMLLTPVFLYLAPVLVNHLHLSWSDQRTAIEIFKWGYGFFYLSLVGGMLGSVLTGIGDLWLGSLIDFGARLIYGIVAIALFVSGFGIWSLVIASTVQVVLGIVVTSIAVTRRFGPVIGNPFRLHRSTIRDLVVTGGWYQGAMVLSALNTDTDPLVIGTLVSAADVGVYNVAFRLARQVIYLPNMLQNALLPAVASSRSEEAGHERTLRTAVVNGNRITSLLGFGAGGVIVALSPVVYRAWLGHLYPGVDLATALLVIASLAMNLGTTVGTVLFATGQTSLVAKIQTAGVLANVALTLGLVFPFGMTGVLIGTIAAFSTMSLISIPILNRQLGLTFYAAVWTWLWRLITATGFAAAACRMILEIVPNSWQTVRGLTVITLTLLCFAYVPILLLGLRLTRFFKDGDLEMLRRVLPGPLGGIASSRWVLLLTGLGPGGRDVLPGSSSSPRAGT